MTFGECMILIISYPRKTLMNIGMRNVSCIQLIPTAKYMMINFQKQNILHKKSHIQVAFLLLTELACISFASVSQLVMLFFNSFFVLDVFLSSVDQSHFNLRFRLSPRSMAQVDLRLASCKLNVLVAVATNLI